MIPNRTPAAPWPKPTPPSPPRTTLFVWGPYSFSSRVGGKRAPDPLTGSTRSRTAGQAPVIKGDLDKTSTKIIPDRKKDKYDKLMTNDETRMTKQIRSPPNGTQKTRKPEIATWPVEVLVIRISSFFRYSGFVIRAEGVPAEGIPLGAGRLGY